MGQKRHALLETEGRARALLLTFDPPTIQIRGGVAPSCATAALALQLRFCCFSAVGAGNRSHLSNEKHDDDSELRPR